MTVTLTGKRSRRDTLQPSEPMSTINLIPVFLTGLAGGLHCIGMCGGIVSAFSMTSERRPFPIPVVATMNADAADIRQRGTAWPHYTVRALGYNSGRIGSYMLAGAIAGSLGGGVLVLAKLNSLHLGFYWMANLILVALGLYMMDVWHGLAVLEKGGQTVWRRISPMTSYLLPMDSNAKAIAMGALWGWLPCGMVYSSLLTAMLSGSARSGALVMLAFGAGTLPTLLAMGILGSHMRSRLQNPAFRLVAGLAILAFGVLGLARASLGTQASWLDSLCISSPLLPGDGHKGQP